jgi:YggT family protein
VTVAEFLTLAIIARAVLSWFPSSRTLAPVTVVLNEATEPLLGPIRRRMPMWGTFDLSPLIAIVLIGVVESVLLSLLAGH